MIIVSSHPEVSEFGIGDTILVSSIIIILGMV